MMRRFFIFILIPALALLGGCGSGKRMSKADKSKLYYDAGIGYINQGDPQNAIDNLKMAHELESKNPQVMHALGLAYFQMGVPETALQWIQKSLVLMPDDPEINNNLASVFIALGQFDKAVIHSSRAIESPDYRTPAAAYFNRGISYLRLGKKEDAEKDFRSAIRHEPMYDLPRVELGRLLLEGNRFVDAVQILTSAIKVNNNNPETYLLRGQAFWHQGFVSRSEADFNTLLKMKNVSPAFIEQAHNWLERLR